MWQAEVLMVPSLCHSVVLLVFNVAVRNIIAKQICHVQQELLKIELRSKKA
jgi:hypothetical protein